MTRDRLCVKLSEERTKRRINSDERMNSGKNPLNKKKRDEHFSLEWRVKFHYSIEKRKIDEGLLSESKKRSKILKSLGRKIYISSPFNFQRNKTIRLEQHDLQTLLAIFHFNISTTYLTHAHTHTCTHSGVISLLHRTLISRIRGKHGPHPANNFHRASSTVI